MYQQPNSIEILPVNNGFLVRIPAAQAYYQPNILSEKDIAVMKEMVKQVKKDPDPVMSMIEESNKQEGSFADDLIKQAGSPLLKDESLFVFKTFQEVIQFLNERYI